MSIQCSRMQQECSHHIENEKEINRLRDEERSLQTKISGNELEISRILLELTRVKEALTASEKEVERLKLEKDATENRLRERILYLENKRIKDEQHVELYEEQQNKKNREIRNEYDSK